MGTIYLSETANPLLISYLKAQGHLVQLIRALAGPTSRFRPIPISISAAPWTRHRLFRGQPDRIG